MWRCKKSKRIVSLFCVHHRLLDYAWLVKYEMFIMKVFFLFSVLSHSFMFLLLDILILAAKEIKSGW